MGQGMRRAPKYVHAFLDRHGAARFYLRRPGFKKVPLPGLPWSPEFMQAYQEALAQQPVDIGAKSTKPGTMRALAISYYNSPTFFSLKPITRSTYRNIIDRFCKGTDSTGQLNGDKRAVGLRREHVTRFMARLAERPESANGLRKALRALMRHAVDIGMREDDPTRDVKAIRVKSDGYHSWTEEEIAEFEKSHSVGSTARLALALLLFTGQRRSDVVRMGRQHVRDGNTLHVRQDKTGRELLIPMHPALIAAIAETPKMHLTFLSSELQRPFTAAGFGNKFRQWCDEAGLGHCTAHGLRKAAARRLAEAGCSVHEIASITGHTSLREVARYTKAADQRRLATAAMEKVKRGTTVGQPEAWFAKKEQNP